MKLTVIPEDRLIIIDNTHLRAKRWPFDDSEINAIQWDGDSGIIEHCDACNQDSVATQADIDPYVAFFNEHKAEIEAEFEAKRQEKTLDYAEVRRNLYPQIPEQLDALYWASAGDSSKLDAINAQIAQIKADYPKDMDPISEDDLIAIMETITI